MTVDAGRAHAAEAMSAGAVGRAVFAVRADAGNGGTASLSAPLRYAASGFGGNGYPDIWLPLLARFEMALLEETGFGLDLSCCAATGVDRGLGLCVAALGSGCQSRGGAALS